jgi:aryl sulfotransferase
MPGEGAGDERTAPDHSPVPYRSNDDDNGRWIGFPFRDGDIVISTRSKMGTTWMQMICALLVFQSPELPMPLAQLSPWLDHLVVSRDEVYAQLEAQRHRRFIKTHTPLDGLPIDPRATFIVVARHPLDTAVSLYHHSANIDRARLEELTGLPQQRNTDAARPSLHDSLMAWIDIDMAPTEALESIRGVMWHLTDAWERRTEPNIVLVHYHDLSVDLDGEMRRLAARLNFDVPEERWPELVDAARFEQMRARARELAPDQLGVLKDRDQFFRRGSSGAAREVLSPSELAHYDERAASMAPEDLLAWLHRED